MEVGRSSNISLKKPNQALRLARQPAAKKSAAGFRSLVTACATRETGLSHYCILLAECRRLLVCQSSDIKGAHTGNTGS
jgi:hypothetical protein